jgi:hypothetical protein
MSDEMRNETIELCVTACEKHSSNNEVNGAIDFLKYYKKIIESIGFSECSKTNQRVYGHQIWTFVARSGRRGIWPRDNSRVPQPALHVFRRQHGSLRLEVLLIQLFYKQLTFAIYIYANLCCTCILLFRGPKCLSCILRAQIPLDLQLYRELEFRQIE